MIRFQACRAALLVGPIVLLAACGSSGVNQATGNLQDRLQAQLRPDIAAGQVTLQPLPAGARVAFRDPTVFAGGGVELDDKGRYVLASTIQALLDPRLMRVEVADTAATPYGDQTSRVQAVRDYFVTYGLGPTLQPTGSPTMTPPGSVHAAPPGLTITINVQCPSSRPPAGDGTDQLLAMCN
jgi:hypothetical protein